MDFHAGLIHIWGRLAPEKEGLLLAAIKLDSGHLDYAVTTSEAMKVYVSNQAESRRPLTITHPACPDGRLMYLERFCQDNGMYFAARVEAENPGEKMLITYRPGKDADPKEVYVDEFGKPRIEREALETVVARAKARKTDVYHKLMTDLHLLLTVHKLKLGAFYYHAKTRNPRNSKHKKK